ncbi:MAG: carboxypeptidase-like regulatory domain-containing protein [Planctomycetota bacterium]
MGLRSRGRNAALLLVALLAIATVVWIGRGAWGGAGRDPAPALPGLAAGESAAAPGASPSSSRVAVDASGERPGSFARPRGTLSFEVRGRVVDPAGTPVPAVALLVREEGPRVRATSDEEGRFSLVARGSPATLLAAGEGWATVRSCLAVAGRPEAENVVVVAPAIALGGVVVAADETPLEGASLEAAARAEDLPGFVPAWRGTGRVEWRAESGSDGRFRLAPVPAFEGGFLRTTRAGFLPDERPLPLAPADDLSIVLARAEPEEIPLSGTVVHADGRPAAGATVRLGSAAARAKLDGAFRLLVRRIDPGADLVGALAGFQPAVQPGFGARLLEAAGAPAPVELVLGPPALALAGRVASLAGEPGKGWRVALAAGTEAAGAEGTLLEELAGAVTCRTDREGRFRIEGLLPGRYVLRAFETPGGPVIESAPIEPPRDDVLLQIPAGPERGPLAGRVVDERGEPVAGVQVGIARADVRRPGREADLLPRVRARTDEAGRFQLEGAAGGWTRIVALGEAILPAAITFSPAEEGPEVELAVVRALRLGFAAGGIEPPEELGALDAAGRDLELWLPEGSGPPAVRRIVLAEGRSPLFAIDARARALVLWRGGRVLDRIAVDSATSGVVRWP